jgi:hypothetical protein
MNEVSVCARFLPQYAPHTGSEHNSYLPSLEGGLYRMGGGEGRNGGEEKGGHKIELLAPETGDYGYCLMF